MRVNDRQFEKFRRLIYQECGINLHEGKKQLLDARLAKRLRKTGIDSVDDYLKLLETNPRELVDFLDAISTNHTFFFREDHHFKHLQSDHRNIWCAASSSGEEPYSIVIHCLEAGFSPSILATDISTHVLDLANNAIYPKERAHRISQPLLKKYFQKGHGRREGFIRVKEEVRRLVSFARFNLLSDPLPAQEFDVIFCRNVLIYFDQPTKENVVNKLYRVLKPGGTFIIGGAESLSGLDHKYKYICPSIYRKS